MKNLPRWEVHISAFTPDGQHTPAKGMIVSKFGTTAKLKKSCLLHTSLVIGCGARDIASSSAFDKSIPAAAVLIANCWNEGGTTHFSCPCQENAENFDALESLIEVHIFWKAFGESRGS